MVANASRQTACPTFCRLPTAGYRLRSAVIALMLLLAASLPVTWTAAQSVQPERDYWPTNGWQTADPTAHGMDHAALLEADRRIVAEFPDVTGLVVARDGYIVFERYYNGYGPEDPINVRSVTKSVTSALIGIAIDDGLLTLESTLGELLPDRLPPSADPRTRDIPLEHLLSMTSGLAWDAGTDYQRLIASDNWVELTLGLPVAYGPGQVFVYNTGGSHLLSVILSEVTGENTATYAAERLFAPLGIEPGTWGRSPQGETNGGFGLELTPRDMAKFGYLYLNEGSWDGAQIIPADYVRRSTTWQSGGDATGGTAYGYQWWVTNVHGFDAYFALGYGGQYIYVVPSLDLVVVIAAGWDTTSPASLRSPRFLIESLIVPAASHLGET